MHVLLWEWDLYTRFLKRVIDRDRQLAPSEEKRIDEGPAKQRKI
jgi:hypothetical protein